MNAALSKALAEDRVNPRLKPLLINYAQKRKIGMPVPAALRLVRREAETKGLADVLGTFEDWMREQSAHPDQYADGQVRGPLATALRDDHPAPPAKS